MKTFRLFSMAALALVMAACSSDDNVIEQQPTQQPGKMHFTATIAAPNSGATTRTIGTLATDNDNKDIINVAWKEGDEIALIHNEVLEKATVTAVNETTGVATIEGSADWEEEPTDGEDVILVYPYDRVFNSVPESPWDYVPELYPFHAQTGTLDGVFSDGLDWREGAGTFSVNGSDVTLSSTVKMASNVAIWKLTLQDNAATPNSLAATKVTVKVGTTTVAETETGSAMSEYYICLAPATMGTGDLTIEATVGSDTYIYTKAGGVSLETSKYYQSTVTMAKLIDLSTLVENYVAQNGDILTGTLREKVQISIANNATVTLAGANILCIDDTDQLTNNGMNWAGITCEGNATINLADGTTNIAKGFNYKYPGIYVPSGSTLTINGNTGKLTAYAPYESYACGIGGGYGLSSGNIVITGGTIIAEGGSSAAGIGGGGQIPSGSQVSCGDITISGGTITASSDDFAPGIGSGCGTGTAAICGNITISGGDVTTIHKGSHIGSAIGQGGLAKCSKVTITDGVNSLIIRNEYSKASDMKVYRFIEATAVYIGTTDIASSINNKTVDDNEIKGYITGLGFTTQSYDPDTQTWTLTKE